MNLPNYISLIFILTTGLTLYLFLEDVKYSRVKTLSILGLWLIVQGLLGYMGFCGYHPK